MNDRAGRPRSLHASAVRRHLVIAVQTLVALCLLACGASDPPPTSPFDDGRPDSTLPPGVETGTPPSLGSPAPTIDPEVPVTPDAPAAPALDAEQAAALAIDLIAEWTGMPASSFAVASVEPAEWGNACLGAARPDEACAEVLTRGMRVELETLLRASVHVVHIAGPGQVRWIPDREVAGELAAVDAADGVLEVNTAEGVERWLAMPGSFIEPALSQLAAGAALTAGLDATADGDAIVWLLAEDASAEE